MSIEYVARMEDPFGSYIKTFSNFVDPTDGGGAGLDYVLNVGKPSVLLLTVPATEDFDIFQIDNRILPLISIQGRSFYNDNLACYFLRKKTISPDGGWFRFTAYHANSLLDRRAVLYMTGSTYANKTAVAAGNQLKAYARENIGSSISAANRDGDETGADLVTPGYLVIEADKGDGASVPKTTDRGALLTILQEIADDSTQDGTYLSFGIIYGSDKKFYFQTRATAWGVDRRVGQPGQLILSPQRGNIENVYLTIDHTDEVTFAVAGGRGQNDERVIATAVDATRRDISPFNRIERYYDAASGDTTTTVQAAADAALRSGNPVISFEADLVETPSATRGIHFDLGDLVTARITVQGQVFQFDCRLDTIFVSVRNGEQRSRVQLRSPI